MKISHLKAVACVALATIPTVAFDLDRSWEYTVSADGSAAAQSVARFRTSAFRKAVPYARMSLGCNGAEREFSARVGYHRKTPLDMVEAGWKPIESHKDRDPEIDTVTYIDDPDKDGNPTLHRLVSVKISGNRKTYKVDSVTVVPETWLDRKRFTLPGREETEMRAEYVVYRDLDHEEAERLLERLISALQEVEQVATSLEPEFINVSFKTDDLRWNDENFIAINPTNAPRAFRAVHDACRSSMFDFLTDWFD